MLKKRVINRLEQFCFSPGKKDRPFILQYSIYTLYKLKKDRITNRCIVIVPFHLLYSIVYKLKKDRITNRCIVIVPFHLQYSTARVKER